MNQEYDSPPIQYFTFYPSTEKALVRLSFLNLCATTNRSFFLKRQNYRAHGQTAATAGQTNQTLQQRKVPREQVKVKAAAVWLEPLPLYKDVARRQEAHWDSPSAP